MKILVIEENPISRKVARVALEAEGYTVIEAADGKSGLEALAREKPDLVLQDLLLPDINGFDLVTRLRALPEGAAVPIVAVTGLIAKADELKVADAPFTDYLFKPVEPSRLVAAVQSHIAANLARLVNPGKARRILAIDGDPDQLKLLQIHLKNLGFDVATAGEGTKGFDKAKSWHPDAILSDVSMPGMDGFQLCTAVRKDPELSRIPVVLLSNMYDSEADRKVARDMGANALVARTPDFQEAINALLRSLQELPPHPGKDAHSFQLEYEQRVAHQLQRQAKRSTELAQLCAVQSAQLSVLGSVGETLMQYPADDKTLLTDILAHYLNVTGLSCGAIYLADRDGLCALSAQQGFPGEVQDALATFFGNQGLLQGAMLKGKPLSLSLSPTGQAPFARILTQLGARAILIDPLLLRAKRLGVVVLVSSAKEMDEKWFSLARTIINNQISQAVALNNAVSRLKFVAANDPVTGLPNRNYLRERLQQAILAGRPAALFAISLDSFQEINNTLSHQNGNLLLRQVGKRLQQGLPCADTIACLGADEFGVLWNGGITVENLGRVSEQILQTLEPSFKVDRLPIEVQASIGAAHYPEHGQDPDTLLNHADIARQAAQKSSNGYALYSSSIDQYSPERLALIGELRQAIEHDELELHYQPKVSFKTGRTIGVEALLRWRHPRQGWLAPGQFIPLAEKTGLIHPLSRWVLGKALSQSKSWRDARVRTGIAVNLSTRDLQRTSLPDHVAQLRQAAGMTRNGLTLEITESALLEDSDKTDMIFRRLSKMGVRFSIDDFGTGYSSLAYLKKLPVSEIKIDLSFVSGMMADAKKATIVRSTIDLGHNLGLTVVAEGVEDKQTWDYLAALGCNAAQGHFLCRPLPPDELGRWMKESPAGVGQRSF